MPASDVLYIASQSFASSKQGIFAALGITTGIAVYVTAAVFCLLALKVLFAKQN
jgi:threonine/homoserine/homoserine lactone efflux protein